MTGKEHALAVLTALKNSTADRISYREEILETIRALHDKVIAMDRQLAMAEKEFVNARTTEFNQFVEALPDVGNPVVEPQNPMDSGGGTGNGTDVPGGGGTGGVDVPVIP